MSPAQTGAREAELVVVTGMSGAGRSTALHALEDLGFYCIDNLPPRAFAAALEACTQDGLAFVAFGIDVRVGPFLKDVTSALTHTPDRYRTTLLFLDASDTALATRFGSTRRPHPLRVLSTKADGTPEPSLSIGDGIQLERERLISLRAQAGVVLDSTEMSVHELRREVLRLFKPRSGPKRSLVVRFVSFGFKYGAAAGCDTLFDVRFLNNPYFVPELRSLTGLDAEIQRFVGEQGDAETFCHTVEELLLFLIPRYQQEGKSYFTVGFGCTGGRHRSVAIAERVAAKIRTMLALELDVVHRDIHRGSNTLRPNSL